MPRIWPSVVAAFFVFHVAANCADAIPAAPMARATWATPRVREEFDAWAHRLGVSRPDLENFLWSAGQDLNAVHSAANAPFVPYLHVLGLRQRWGLFVGGARYRERLEIRTRTCAVDADCAWETIYLRGDPTHQRLATLLESTRLRTAIASCGINNRNYARGCRAIAVQVLADVSDAQAVQCRFVRGLTPSPGDAGASWAPDPKSEIVVKRTAP